MPIVYILAAIGASGVALAVFLAAARAGSRSEK